MIELKGRYNDAKVFATTIEEEAINQIQTVLDHPAFEQSLIRIMPDVHAGAGCVIGFTQKGLDNVVPNLVGVDGSCGVLALNLGKDEIDFQKLDDTIHKHIPSGTSVNSTYTVAELDDLFSKLQPDRVFLAYMKTMNKIAERVGVSEDRLWKSVGTLGGGNHFIAINRDSNDTNWLVIHSGSRHMGLKVAEFWQSKAIANLDEYLTRPHPYGDVVKNKGLAWLHGEEANDYMRDMDYIHMYADLNRWMIATRIIDYMGFNCYDDITTVHNYIDGNIIRKGAVRANEGERVVIPLNMKDGVIFGIGKGNRDWNFSAPHGAGRKMSRGDARRTLSMKDFEDTMKGVYSTTVVYNTLDEAPAAYKDASEILENVSDTIEIYDVAREIYNFKATK